MLEVRLEIILRLHMKQVFGRFSEMVAPLAPICGDLDRSVDEFICFNHFIEGPGTERFFCRPNLIFKKESSAHLLANQPRQQRIAAAMCLPIEPGALNHR